MEKVSSSALPAAASAPERFNLSSRLCLHKVLSQFCQFFINCTVLPTTPGIYPMNHHVSLHAMHLQHHLSLHN